MLQCDEKIIKRFWSKTKLEPNGCIVYTEYRDKDGYGQFTIRHNEPILAHRFAFFLKHGYLPKGDNKVLHTCDNPPCVNWEHLYEGTHTQNMLDMLARHREAHLIGEAHYNAKLNNEKVIEIKKLIAQGVKGVEIARRFNVRPPTITLIKQGKQWGHVNVS